MINHNNQNLLGEQHGEWRVIGYAGQDSCFRRLWICECIFCGEQKVRRTNEIKQRTEHGRCTVKKKMKLENGIKNRCKSCEWWMRLSMSYGNACHYCYYNDHRRERDTDGNCLSYLPRTGQNHHRQTDIVFGKEKYEWLPRIR